MNEIEKNINKLIKIQDQLDTHIWEVFSKYIKAESVRFSSPDIWQIQGDVITFIGTDGCMGCYDQMSLDVPLKFFIDTEKEFEILKTEKHDKEMKYLEAVQARKETQEKNEYLRLKEKYESGKD